MGSSQELWAHLRRLSGRQRCRGERLQGLSHFDEPCSSSKALCPRVQAEPSGLGRRAPLVPAYSILTSSFVLRHRAKPQLVSSLIPKAASPQEALRHLEAECPNPRAGGTPRGPRQAPCALPPPVALKADLRGGFQCEQFMWEVSPTSTVRGSETGRQAKEGLWTPGLFSQMVWDMAAIWPIGR